MGVFWRLFRAWQEKVLPGEAQGAAVLEFIGANPIIVSWAQSRREGLGALWEACLRADWQLEIAHRAGLPLARLERAVRSLPLELGDRAWANLDDLLGELTPALDRLVDENPRHAELAALYESFGNPPEGLRRPEQIEVARQYRLLPGELHEQYARAVRERISYRDVRDALYPPPATGPYR